MILSLMILSRFMKEVLGCAEDEYSFQGNQCLQCSDFIALCSSCSSGEYTAITNSSFEDPVVQNYLYTINLPGWAIEPGKEAEINTDFLYPPQDGLQFLQIVGYENYYIYQDIATEVGQLYQVEFYLSPFASYSSYFNSLIVYWGDTSNTIPLDGAGLNTSNWVLYETDIIQATSSTTRLKFQGANAGNGNIGPVIDNVVLKNLPSCLTCNQGYYLSNDSCNSCSDYDINCVSCDSRCNECSSGHILYQSSCFLCDSECQTCSDSGKCLVCKDKYYLENDECLRCPDICQICTSSTVCTDCSAGYYAFQGDCLQCLETIQSCPSDGDGLSCSDGYYLESLLGQCYDCPKNCSKCESLSKCTECKSSYALQDEECICSEGRFEQDNSCVACTSIDAECILCDSSGCLQCSSDYNAEKGKCSRDNTQDNSYTEKENEDETEESIYNEEELIASVSGEACGTYSSLGGVTISAVISLISADPSTLWTFMNIGTVSYLIPLMNLEMTRGTKDFFKNFGNILPDSIPSLKTLFGLKESDFRESSERWKEYGIRTTSFILNCGRNIVLFLVLLSCLPILCIFYCLCFCKKHLKKLLLQYKWNFFFRFWIQMYLELLTCNFLNIMSISDNSLSIEEWASVFLFVLEVLTPFLLVFYTMKHKKNIQSKSTFEKCSFFADFKKDRGMSRMMFYVLFFGRRICLVLGLFLLENFPIIQVAINVFLGFSIIAYLVVFKPFIRKSKQFVNFVSEIYLVAVFSISGASLAGSSEDFLNILNYLIVASIAITMCLYFATAVVLVIGFFVFSKTRKRRNQFFSQEENVTIVHTLPNRSRRKSQEINSSKRRQSRIKMQRIFNPV